MDSLAHRALLHSQAFGWNLLDLPAQLRISTIDSFCRDLALQQPLLSGFGGGLEIAEQPDELYRRAARETLRKIDQIGSALGAAIEELLLWRDNGCRRWKSCWSKCSRAATAGCTTLCWSVSRIGMRSANVWSARLQMECAPHSSG